MKRGNQAWAAGYRAQRTGGARNPYAPGTADARQWALGWRAGLNGLGCLSYAEMPPVQPMLRAPRVMRRLAAVALIAAAMSGCATPAESRWALPDGRDADLGAMPAGLTACAHNPDCSVWR